MSRRELFAVLATVVALVTTGCAASGGDEGVDLGFGHIHGVDVNPADGTVYAATSGPSRCPGRVIGPGPDR